METKPRYVRVARPKCGLCHQPQNPYFVEGDDCELCLKEADAYHASYLSATVPKVRRCKWRGCNEIIRTANYNFCLNCARDATELCAGVDENFLEFALEATS